MQKHKIITAWETLRNFHRLFKNININKFVNFLDLTPQQVYTA